jgi:pyruvate ferredoxin oxidoreductase gamma subunit/2-oxoisovalerate ferredoxin oxidoreductase gamma subunit
MIEIRFHGRGGQGTVVASILLAKAFFRDGYQVQTFPVFGLERRGAPVEAYLRLDANKILIRSNVYTPDHVVVQDMKLLGNIDVTQGLKPGGTILFNAKGILDDLEPFNDFRLAFVDAAQIAVQHHLGTRTNPIVNTAMIGAFARVIDMPSMTAIADTIIGEIQIKTNQNVQAAQEAYEKVTIIKRLGISTIG